MDSYILRVFGIVKYTDNIERILIKGDSDNTIKYLASQTYSVLNRPLISEAVVHVFEGDHLKAIGRIPKTESIRLLMEQKLEEEVTEGFKGIIKNLVDSIDAYPE
jgi:hypothetical protein